MRSYIKFILPLIILFFSYFAIKTISMKRLFTLLILFPILGFSQTTAIPDANFEQALIDLGFDTGTPDGSVPTANISGIDTLDLSNSNISDLTGIEDFNALVFFLCMNNQLTNLDLSNNTLLRNVSCYNNQLVSINVSQNTALVLLQCQNNQLSTLDVSNNIGLLNLGCHNNQITALDVSHNSSLVVLNCGYNNLSCLNLKNIDTSAYFTAYSNSNLSCVEVDYPIQSTANWTNIDSGVTYSTNCNYPINCYSPSGFSEINNEISIYPNPTNNLLHIEIENYNGTIAAELYDFTGKLLETTNNTSLSLSDYPKGIYLLKVAYGDKTEEIRVVKE